MLCDVLFQILTLSNKPAGVPCMVCSSFPDINSNIFISFCGQNNQDPDSRGEQGSEADERPEAHSLPAPPAVAAES